MNLREREVLPHDSHLVAVFLLHLLQRRRDALAEGALEVRELHQGHRRRCGPERRVVRRQLDFVPWRVEQHAHLWTRLAQLGDELGARRFALLVLKVSPDRRRHHLERSSLHLVDVRLVERDHVRFADGLRARLHLGLLVGLRRHVLRLGGLGDQHLGDDRIECRPLPVVRLLRGFGMPAGIERLPAIVDLLDRDDPIANPGSGVSRRPAGRAPMSRQTTTQPPSGTALSSCWGSYCLRSSVSNFGASVLGSPVSVSATSPVPRSC